MLTDPPQPADLPDRPSEPYAALPAELLDVPAGARTPQARPAPGTVRGRAPAVVALALVLVLVAALALAVTRWAAPVPSALPTSPVASSVPGASTAPSPSARATTVTPTGTDHPRALDRFYTQPVSWAPCSDSGQHLCTTIEVPVDYAKPAGDTFELALRKVPALEPSKRIGSLLINPGGPGGSGLEYAQYASFLFSKELRTVYDIVGFDPRGIGASDAVSCLTNADMDRLFAADPTPDTPAERSELVASAEESADHCAAKGGQRALHMSSTEVARDMDIMRALVGDPKLNFFGVSYGTFLGALYADLFPRRVGRFVLDSAVSPNQTDLEGMVYDAQGFEASLDAFLTWCVARDDCALGKDKAKARAKIIALLDRIDQKPLRTSKQGLPRVGEGWVGFAIFMCLYSETTWPTLNRGLDEALTKGSADVLVSRAFAVVGRSSKGGYDKGTYLQAVIPVRCADWPRTPDTADYRARRDRLYAAHPLWARLAGETVDPCRTWPAPGRTPKRTKLGVGAAPILVVGNLRDPATPVGGTEQLAKDLDSGTLLIADSDGHGAYYSGNSCVDGVVDSYIIRGALPTAGKSC